MAVPIVSNNPYDLSSGRGAYRTRPRRDILRLFADGEPRPAKVVAEYFGQPVRNIRRVLGRMVEQGWIEVEPGYVYRITPNGYAALTQVSQKSYRSIANNDVPNSVPNSDGEVPNWTEEVPNSGNLVPNSQNDDIYYTLSLNSSNEYVITLNDNTTVRYSNRLVDNANDKTKIRVINLPGSRRKIEININQIVYLEIEVDNNPIEFRVEDLGQNGIGISVRTKSGEVPNPELRPAQIEEIEVCENETGTASVSVLENENGNAAPVPLFDIPGIENNRRTENENSERASGPVRRARKRTVTRADDLPDDIRPLFDRFWSVYPRRVNKAAAVRAFAAHAETFRDPDRFDRILGALERQIASDGWQKDGGKYIPHPATWINGERWEDELGPVRRPDPDRVERFVARWRGMVDDQASVPPPPPAAPRNQTRSASETIETLFRIINKD